MTKHACCAVSGVVVLARPARASRAAAVRGAGGAEAADDDDHVRDGRRGRAAFGGGRLRSGGRRARAIVPGRCEVRGVIRPTKDSEIKFALWLPASGWNGKYRQEGNGGWAGAINTAAWSSRCAAATRSRPPTTATKAAARIWAIGHPEKLIDFGHRAVHETSVQAKAIVRAFYGRDPSAATSTAVRTAAVKR